MPDLGKIDREFFDSVIYPHLGAERDDVVVGPRHGVDFGVLDVDGTAVVTATDPISILPQLGFERAGRFALDVVLADVAVSGVPPSHLSISLTLPPEMTDEELAEMWVGISDHARELGVSIVSGHTARYAGVDYSWVGGATVLGVGDSGDVVRPDGATVGDSIVVTTGPGAEVAALFAVVFPDRLGLAESTLETARGRLEEFGVVRDTMAAVDAGTVTAMHDATEGGLLGALTEMAHGAGVRFDVDGEAVPAAPGVVPVTDAIDVDPWEVTSTGTLVIIVQAEDAESVVNALQRRGTRAAVVGQVSSGSGVFVDGDQRHPPESDPAWNALDRLSER
ncbi:AIR synthase family protein [Halobacteria archaeon HArc-gm2]|nr:AIR synthase family protein [Halobacteria archaeon HArc-gm2]